MQGNVLQNIFSFKSGFGCQVRFAEISLNLSLHLYDNISQYYLNKLRSKYFTNCSDK